MFLLQIIKKCIYLCALCFENAFSAAWQYVLGKGNVVQPLALAEAHMRTAWLAVVKATL